MNFPDYKITFVRYSGNWLGLNVFISIFTTYYNMQILGLERQHIAHLSSSPKLAYFHLSLTFAEDRQHITLGYVHFISKNGYAI